MQRTFRLTCPLTAVRRLDNSRFQFATLPPDSVVIYRGPLGLANLAEVAFSGETYGVFLCDLELNGTEFLSFGD